MRVLEWTEFYQGSDVLHYSAALRPNVGFKRLELLQDATSFIHSAALIF